MKKLIAPSFLLFAICSTAIAEPLKGTATEYKKYHKVESEGMEHLIDKLKSSPNAVIDEEVEYSSTNYKATTLNIEVSGIDLRTNESCHIVLKKESNVATPLHFYRYEGFLGVDQSLVSLPKVTTDLHYTLKLVNSIYTEKHGRYISARGETSDIWTKRTGVSITQSNTIPKVAGHRSIMNAKYGNDNTVLITAERKLPLFQDGDWEVEASCLIEL